MKSIYVSNAEIKKSLSKSGIWILCMLLAVVLVLSALFFKPEERHIDKYVITGTETSEIRNRFLNAKTSVFDVKLASSADYLENYTAENSIRTSVETLVDDFFTTVNIYVADTIANRNNLTVLSSDRQAVYSAVRSMKEEIFDLIDSANAENPIFLVLTSKQNYTTFKTLLATFENLFTPSAPNNAEQHVATTNSYQSTANGYKNKLENAIDALYFPTIKASVLNELTENETTLTTRLDAIIAKMDELLTSINSEDKTIEEKEQANTSVLNRRLMAKYADDYYQTINTYTNLLTKKIKYEVVVGYNGKNITDLKYFENYDSYPEKESLSVYEYLFKTDKSINDFALNFKMGTTSNANKNAYDFAFFSMEIFAFLILIYAIMNGASSIASENNAGTMKFIAIRPVTRTNIYYGKFLANCFMSLIMLLFATAVSFIVGGILYSFNSLPILSVINATKVMVSHPSILFLSYIFSLLLKLVVYITFAMFLSCLLKNGVVAITLGISFYFVNMILGIVAGTASWLRFYPFANLRIYNYFGSLSVASDNIFSKLFGSQIIGSTNLLWPIVSIILLIFVFNFVSLLVFRKRDMQ